MSGLTDNQNALKHGHERSLKKLSQGTPFASETHQIYLDKLADMGLTESDLTGAIGLLAQETSRLFTVSELFWQAMLGAASAGDLEKFEKLARRFGWISGKAVKSLGTFNEVQNGDDSLDYEQIIKRENE